MNASEIDGHLGSAFSVGKPSNFRCPHVVTVVKTDYPWEILLQNLV